MHEFALIQDLMEKTAAEMRAKKAKSVKSIELNVGKSSGYSPESLKQAFEILAADTELRGSRLVLKNVTGVNVTLRRIVLEQ